MQMLCYVFRCQKTEVTGNISRNTISLCAEHTRVDASMGSRKGVKCSSEEGLQSSLKLCFYHLASFPERFCKLPCCYNKVLGCPIVPPPQLKVTLSQIIVKEQQRRLLLSGRALQQQQSDSTQTKPLRACRRSHATPGRHLNGDSQAGGMQIRCQHVPLSGEPALAQPAPWYCIWAVSVLGSAPSFFAETGGKRRSWTAGTPSAASKPGENCPPLQMFIPIATDVPI